MEKMHVFSCKSYGNYLRLPRRQLEEFRPSFWSRRKKRLDKRRFGFEGEGEREEEGRRKEGLSREDIDLRRKGREGGGREGGRKEKAGELRGERL